MRRSKIAPDILQAYVETEYRIFAQPPFAVKISEYSVALQALHQTHGVACSIFVSACNPYSQPCSQADNRRRHQHLVEQVERAGLAWVAGVGQHPGNQWPGEDSLLLLGLDLGAAKRWGRQLEQNALVFCPASGIPELVLLR